MTAFSKFHGRGDNIWSVSVRLDISRTYAYERHRASLRICPNIRSLRLVLSRSQSLDTSNSSANLKGDVPRLTNSNGPLEQLESRVLISAESEENTER